MATTFHRPLGVLAFNANDIEWQHYELRKQLHEQHTDETLLSETRLKPHGWFFIPNYHFYRTDGFPGSNCGRVVAVHHNAGRLYSLSRLNPENHNVKGLRECMTLTGHLTKGN
jgi:hypothetical protein